MKISNNHFFRQAPTININKAALTKLQSKVPAINPSFIAKTAPVSANPVQNVITVQPTILLGLPEQIAVQPPVNPSPKVITAQPTILLGLPEEVAVDETPSDIPFKQFDCTSREKLLPIKQDLDTGWQWEMTYETDPRIKSPTANVPDSQSLL